MNRVKILIVGMSPNLGGIESYIINLYRNINKDLFDLYFLSFEKKEICFYSELKDKIITITNRKDNYFKFIKEIKKTFKENSFDIMHFNLMSFSLFEPIVLANKHSNAKIILHSHTANAKSDSIKNKILSFIGKVIIKKSKFKLLACSKDAGNFMFNSFKHNNFQVVNNGVDYRKFYFNEKHRNEFRNKFGIKKDEILIGNVGRLVESKNHSFLLDLLNNLSEKYKVLIIGDGPQEKIIKEKAKEMELINRLIIIKNINNVNEVMSAMDVFVFPSKFEGLGIVLIEAQLNGLKCIINSNLPKEIDISDGIIRVPSYEIDDWKKRVLNNNKRTQNTINNYHFDIKETTSEIEKIYIDLNRRN